MTLSRRNFLTGATSLIATSAYANNPSKYIFQPEINYNNDSSITTTNLNNILPQQNTQDFWDLPREIYLHNQSTGEKANLVYFKNGQINQEHYWLASYMLRDIRQQKMMNMDIKLLNLICAVQAWLKFYGYTNPILITSGFRTQKTNSSLDGAAQNSMHLVGKAIDFTVPGLSILQIGKIASHFQAGGIGLYPNRGFIHLDTGRIRTWKK